MQKKIDTQTIQGAVYEELKKGIMTLILEPGVSMSTQEMAMRLNVSRTPVREAFLRLQQEGLVESIPQKGTTVSRINLLRVNQERFVRESLEIALVSDLMQNSTTADYAKLEENLFYQKELYNKKEYAEFVRLDNLFHKLFFDAAGQSLAWDIISSNSGHYNRIRILGVQNDAVISSNIAQHELMLEYLKKKDADAFCALLVDHIRKYDYKNLPAMKIHPDYFAVDEKAGSGFHINAL